MIGLGLFWGNTHRSCYGAVRIGDVGPDAIVSIAVAKEDGRFEVEGLEAG